MSANQKTFELAEQLLGERVPFWLLENLAKDIEEYIEDWIIVHAEAIEESKIR